MDMNHRSECRQNKWEFGLQDSKQKELKHVFLS